VGVQTAAQLLITAGDNPDRLYSEAAFAAMRCQPGPGVLRQDPPAPAEPRRRLSGNSALWTIANNRLMHEPRNRAYAARRTTMGNSRKEILRCVKRALARELYPLILDALALQRLP
jgi:hypothetical protein